VADEPPSDSHEDDRLTALVRTTEDIGGYEMEPLDSWDDWEPMSQHPPVGDRLVIWSVLVIVGFIAVAIVMASG